MARVEKRVFFQGQALRCVLVSACAVLDLAESAETGAENS